VLVHVTQLTWGGLIMNGKNIATPTPKELSILRHFLEIGRNKPHYGANLVELIFSEETIKKWKDEKLSGLVKDRMAFLYLGKIAKKGYLMPSYKSIKNYVYFEGYFLTQKGIELAEQNTQK
jgi:hypothetical protein